VPRYAKQTDALPPEHVRESDKNLAEAGIPEAETSQMHVNQIITDLKCHVMCGKNTNSSSPEGSKVATRPVPRRMHNISTGCCSEKRKNSRVAGPNVVAVKSPEGYVLSTIDEKTGRTQANLRTT
jgi:hypothetical protein